MKFEQKIANLPKFPKFAKFQKFQIDNLVDFEKCCKTRIYLQRSVPIQPKTSEVLPKFCRSAVVSPTDAAAGGRLGAGAGGECNPPEMLHLSRIFVNIQQVQITCLDSVLRKQKQGKHVLTLWQNKGRTCSFSRQRKI